MSQRDEFLNRLQTSFECPESWDGMQGSESSRFCSQCQCEVFDLAQMTADEVQQRLEATRGKMCARMTREGGRLLLQRPADKPSPPRRRIAGKISPIAATLLGAWLSIGYSGAQTSTSETSRASSLDSDPDRAEPDRAEEDDRRRQELASSDDAALSGTLRDGEGLAVAGATVVVREVLGGQERTAVSDDFGFYLFERLPTGVYDLRAELKGLEFDQAQNLILEAGKERAANLKASLVRGMTTMGIMMPPQLHLRDRFDYSDLVVLAVVEESVVASELGGFAKVETQLHIVQRIKGEPAVGPITFRHTENASSLDPDSTNQDSTDPDILKPGDEVVAFLRRVQTRDLEAEPIFEQTGYYNSVFRLDRADREAYLERSEALAGLEKEAQNRGGLNPSELMDWMVETAANPSTRGETISEIQDAFEALENLARKKGKERAALARKLEQIVEKAGGRIVHADVRPIFLGAAITEAHQQQLTAALWATQRVDLSDRKLFDLVVSWDRPEAARWLRSSLPVPEVSDGQFEWWLFNIAKRLENGKARAFMTSANARWTALSPLDRAEREARSRALSEELLSELADLLEGEPVSAAANL